ncbi:hypothetical protein PLCT2_00625 [Planctomycetaceae bacterium]|nr:hypothetical protein PLCT2_00625 [Planctomycetaceae bacterium]
MAGTTDYLRHSKRGEPVWELAQVEFPLQGYWTEAEFLARDLEVRVEFVRGVLEFLSVPTDKHQAILQLFYEMLIGFVRPKKLGKVRVSGIYVRTLPGLVREPDVAFMKTENQRRIEDKAWQGADLVLEVVSGSDSDRKRDLVDKREEYAAAAIPEYWIADYDKGSVTVLALKGKKYVEHCVCKRGETAKSKLLQGFEVEVKDLLDAE